MYKKITEFTVKELNLGNYYSTYIFVMKGATLFIGIRENGKVTWHRRKGAINSIDELSLVLAAWSTPIGTDLSKFIK